MAKEQLLTEFSDARRSIIIALDPSAPGYASLGILRHLLDRRDRQFLGLVIEDTDLLAHAHSRMATEVALSGVARPLELTVLERQIRAQSAAIRQAFEREAARVGLPYAFKILRGKVTGEFALAAAGAEMVIVELPRAATGTESVWSNRLEQICKADLPTVLYAREGWTGNNTVLAVIETLDDIEATLHAAGVLARAGAATLTALISEDVEVEDTRVQAVLNAAMREGSVRIRRLAPLDLASRSLAYLARTGHARALVAPARLANSNRRFMREILQLTRCSIVLVNPPCGR